MAYLYATYPLEIAYSPSSVVDRIYVGDGEAGAPVEAWKDGRGCNRKKGAMYV